MRCARIGLLVVTMVAAIGVSPRATGGPIEEDEWSPGEDHAVTVSDTGGNEAIVRILNESQDTAFNFRVEIEGVTQGATAPGFEMIDTTQVTVSETGGLRARKRMKKRTRKKITRNIRRALRRRKKREKDLCLARLRNDVWRPCSRVMKRRAKKREKVSFDLGAYGVDTTGGYVWAVTDLPGSYAIGVPEPATIGCLVLGAGVLLAAGRRRRR